MFNKNHDKLITIVALIISVIAIGLSGYAIYNTNNTLLKADTLGMTDQQFDAKVEKGIENYVKKQQDEYTKTQAEQAQKDSQTVVSVSADDDAVKGKSTAKVTIVEFSDFECPYCSKFYKEAYAQIVKDYINTGKVKLIHRDFPLSFHANAKNAAMAAECAGDEGDTMYYKYHDKLYENQSSFSDANFKKWAKELGLNTTTFNKCLDSKKYSNEVDKDAKDGESYGVSGTPAFFINGRKLVGAQPFSAFKTIIEEELKK